MSADGIKRILLVGPAPAERIDPVIHTLDPYRLHAPHVTLIVDDRRQGIEANTARWWRNHGLTIERPSNWRADADGADLVICCIHQRDSDAARVWRHGEQAGAGWPIYVPHVTNRSIEYPHDLA